MVAPQITSKVEFAFGANLTADPATWTWTDVSTYALGSVSVTAGRADEAALTQPTRCTFRLANTDARFTPRHPGSPYYPNVRRQTPVRVSLNPGTGYAQRFVGYIDAIIPAWPAGNSTVAEVSVVASGILRRLSQGRKPLASALYRAYANSAVTPLVYYPIEDGVNSTLVRSGLQGGQPAIFQQGSFEFAQVSSCPGSAPLPQMAISPGFAVAVATIPTGPDTFFAIDFTATVANSTIPASAGCPVLTALVSGGTWTDVNIVLNNNFGSLQFFGTRPNLSQDMFGQYDPGSLFDGLWHHYRVTATQSGGNVNFTVECDGVQVVTNTIAGTLAHLTTLQMFAQNNVSYSYGHVAVFGQTTTSFYQPSTGWSGETATARITRLCSENSVQVSIAGSSTTAMGPQGVDTLLNLLRECETADLGILYDGAISGLSYLARPNRYNQAVAMALDANRSQIKLPFQPVEDDQLIRNDWTITRPGGSSAHYGDSVHIAANGLYDSAASVNQQGDAGLLDQATWRVHLGTADEMRVPTLTFDPLHSPELQQPWSVTTLGTRLTATNIPSQFPPGMLDQIVEGYKETWDAVSWFVTVNLSPYRTWEVFTIQDARLGRIETDGSTLTGGPYSSGAASFSVASSGGLWDTGSTPFDIDCEGEQITVTSVTGSSSPQTFAVTRSVNGVVKGHSTGAVVKLWRPGVIAL